MVKYLYVQRDLWFTTSLYDLFTLVHVDPDQYDNEPPQLVSLQFLPPLSDVQQHLLYTELAIDLYAAPQEQFTYLCWNGSPLLFRYYVCWNSYGNDIETGTHVSFVVDTALRLRLHIRDNLSGLQRLFMDGEPRILSYIQVWQLIYHREHEHDYGSQLRDGFLYAVEISSVGIEKDGYVFYREDMWLTILAVF